MEKECRSQALMAGFLHRISLRWENKPENQWLTLPDTVLAAICASANRPSMVSLTEKSLMEMADEIIASYEKSGEKPTDPDKAKRAANMVFLNIEKYQVAPLPNSSSVTATIKFRYEDESPAHDAPHFAEYSTEETSYGEYKLITIDGGKENYAYVINDPLEAEPLVERMEEFLQFGFLMWRLEACQDLVADRQFAELTEAEFAELDERYQKEILFALQDNIMVHAAEEMRQADSEERLERMLTRLNGAIHWAYTKKDYKWPESNRIVLEKLEADKREELTK